MNLLLPFPLTLREKKFVPGKVEEGEREMGFLSLGRVFPYAATLRVKSLDVSIFDDRGRHPGN